jgi:p-hydroxybenzoate 3-monooxygenase
MRTQVGIIGAGPAGLLLSHLLHLEGISSIIIEARSREYCETRVRAGLLEQNSVDLLNETGLADRMNTIALPHDGVQFTYDNTYSRIDMTELIGRRVTIYAQQEIVKDIIAVRLRDGGHIDFEAEAKEIGGLDGGKPFITYMHEGSEKRIDCDYIAGCDGFHGISRESMPASIVRGHDRVYPFGWLGMLIAAKPPSHELIYSHHPEGFTLFSMRAPEITRSYLQVRPDDDIKNWSEDRMWSEMRKRLGKHEGLELNEGEILQASITPMRSYVSEPMRYGALFLAGDSAHIVPPTGAKGMNLAMADVCVLARALIAKYKLNREDYMDSYSDTCLKRVWRAEHFSWWMTTMLHPFYDASPFDLKRQIAELHTVFGSRAGQMLVAENYAGLPIVPWRP